MKCGNCNKESLWLEIIGIDFICRKCIGKHKIFGLILRTHMDTFNLLIKKLKINKFDDLLKVKQKDIENAVDLKQHGVKIFLKKEKT